MQEKKIELVEGYGVYLTQRQLDGAVSGAKSNTHLMRNLLGVFFFTKEVLATSSACGTRRHKALDQNILDSCICKLILNLHAKILYRYCIYLEIYIMSNRFRATTI